MKHFSDKTLDPEPVIDPETAGGPAAEGAEGGTEGGAEAPPDAAAEGEERRSRLGAWWQRLRPPGVSRPLQINELALAAEEHLRAAAMPSLENLYLPSRLKFRISEADWGNLMPFDDYIEEEIGTVYARLLGEPGFAALVGKPEIKVLKGQGLTEGDPPEVTSQFHRRFEQARWCPGQRGVAVRPGPAQARAEVNPPADNWLAGNRPEVEAAGLLEVLATPGVQQATARQSLRVLCLEETLPLSLVDARAKPGDFLRMDGEGRPVTADGTPFSAAPWEALPPIAELPRLEAPVTAAMAELPLLLIKPPGRPPVCWAPGGLVVIGRDPLRSNWVPDGAPANLSGRHLAIAWRVDEGAFFALDLGSTNGIYRAGSRLPPLRPVRLELPECISIGTEGSLNLELYPVARPGMQPGMPPRRTAVQPTQPRSQDELDDLPLR